MDGIGAWRRIWLAKEVEWRRDRGDGSGRSEQSQCGGGGPGDGRYGKYCGKGARERQEKSSANTTAQEEVSSALYMRLKPESTLILIHPTQHTIVHEVHLVHRS